MSVFKEKHLIVFDERSEYVIDNTTTIFSEGKLSEFAKERYKNVKNAFENGFLENIIIDIKLNKSTIAIEKLNDVVLSDIHCMVDGVTSEVGRALLALTIMQLAIKAISPQQNIRLHKGSSNTGSFSWVDGISMRVLDKSYVTPVLRKYRLIQLNADGFMMTRSLAENYPYTSLYKARLRGARENWLNIVEALETGCIDALETLKYIVSLLLNKANEFTVLSEKLLETIRCFCRNLQTMNTVKDVILRHIEKSDYAARLLEVAMHALMQAALYSGGLGSSKLKSLSQMRSANKKHGNIGDIELLDENGKEIIEAWDAKFGKSYLRDEIDEITEKLEQHESVVIAGFVTTETPMRNEEINNKLIDIQNLHNCNVQILSFDEWIEYVIDKIKAHNVFHEDFPAQWLIAYAETLAQKRKEIAPIDEPCYMWIKLLHEALEDIAQSLPEGYQGNHHCERS